jgi:hypothetical protein
MMNDETKAPGVSRRGDAKLRIGTDGNGSRGDAERGKRGNRGHEHEDLFGQDLRNLPGIAMTARHSVRAIAVRFDPIG